MTGVARSLDDIDRLAFRLSRTVRTQYPQLLTQGFTLTDLEERLLPYRDVRREMADGGAEAFESSVLQLIAGERGYLIADEALQAACRQALGFPSPTLAMIRTWSSSTLHLARPASGTPAAGTVYGSGAAASIDVFSPPSDTWRQAAAPREESAIPAPASRPVTPMAPDASAATMHRSCRFCNHRLPDQRQVTFCPHCGLDLTKRQCPACSTELEAHWRFCVTCGRREG